MLSSLGYSQKPENGNSPSSPQGDPIRAYLNLNNISTIFKSEGISDINIGQDASGFVYPFGSGKTAVYESGLIWGVKIAGDLQVRVGGSAYRRITKEVRFFHLALLKIRMIFTSEFTELGQMSIPEFPK